MNFETSRRLASFAQSLLAGSVGRKGGTDGVGWVLDLVDRRGRGSGVGSGLSGAWRGEGGGGRARGTRKKLAKKTAEFKKGGSLLLLPFLSPLTFLRLLSAIYGELEI